VIGRLVLSFLLGGASALFGQAIPTASRAGDAQIGIGYSAAKPDYIPQTFQGIAAYADFDFRPHLGIEAEFHQANNIGSYQSFQRTYEIGGRYLRAYGPLVPYVKVLVGRGQFEYPYGEAEANYTMYAGGAGVDFKLGLYLRVRGEYEFQKWTSFPNGGLTPHIVTIGLAYHFAGKPRFK
jgi:hypothetical protein